MTEDRHDARIRDLVAELAASAPPAPAFRRIADRLSDRNRGSHMSTPSDATIPDADGTADGERAYVSDRPQRSKPWRLMAALVAFSLATAGGAFAYGALSEDDGASTPEKAVEHFVEAFADSDVSGMLEALAPSERVILRESLESLNSQAGRLGLTKDLDLGDVSGAAIEVTGLELTATGLGEDVAAVNVEGTVRSTATAAELPLGDVARDLLVDVLPEDGYQGVADAIDNGINRQELQIVTLREGDGWHVSVWYTLAEYLRRDMGLDVPNFGNSPITPRGAESPEAALRSLLAAGPDFAKAVALATPEESRVLYDYVPVLEADDSVYERTDFQVHRLDTHVEGDGDRRIVHIDAFDIEWTETYTYAMERDVGSEAEETQVSTSRRSFDGDCFSSNYSYKDGSGTELGDPQTDKTCRKDALADGVTALEWDLVTTTQLTVERHDGRWFVSPVRSLVGAGVANLARVPDSSIFRTMTTDDDGSFLFLLLPEDVLAIAFGNPPYTGLYLYLGTALSGEGSSESESGSSSTTTVVGPPDTSPAPTATTGLPIDPATTIPAETVPGTAVPGTAVPGTVGTQTTVPGPTVPPTTGG